MEQIRKKKTQAAQVYFPKSVYFQIKMRATAEKKPAATWIRDVVIQELGKPKKRGKRFSDLKTFSFPGVDPYTSEKIDQIYDIS